MMMLPVLALMSFGLVIQVMDPVLSRAVNQVGLIVMGT